MTHAEHRPAPAFGERFALATTTGLAGLALYLAAGSIVTGRPYAFCITLGCLPLYYGYRARAAGGEQRRGEAMEDERDAWFRAQADRCFRIVASCWCGLLALALAIAPVRDALPANPYAVPGLVLLGVIVADIAGHLASARLYRRDREAAA